MSFFHHQGEEAFPGPLPPMSGLDYQSVMKFLDFAEERCAEEGQSLDPVYDWLIRCLLNSLVSDSASRIFLPKTQTKQFERDDLLPLYAAAPRGTGEDPVGHSFIIAPIWGNADAVDAILTLQKRGGAHEGPRDMVVGAYIKELNLAIIEKAVHEMYFTRFGGARLCDAGRHSLKKWIRCSPPTERTGLSRKAEGDQPAGAGCPHGGAVLHRAGATARCRRRSGDCGSPAGRGAGKRQRGKWEMTMSEETRNTGDWLAEELAMINGKMAATLNGRLKAELESYDEAQEITLRYPLQAWQVNGLGTLHGGMISTMMDLTMSMAVYCFSRQSDSADHDRELPAARSDGGLCAHQGRGHVLGKRNATAHCETIVPRHRKVGQHGDWNLCGDRGEGIKKKQKNG